MGIGAGVRAAAPDATDARIAALEKQVAASSARLSSMHLAQLFDRPADDVPNGQAREGDQAAQPQPEDPGSASVRLDRLENQLRSLTGRIEKAEFDIRRVEEKLEKFKQDVDFRFQDVSGGRPRAQRRSDAADKPGTPDAPPPPVRTAHRGDAFDPNADPAAPGAPRPLGSAEDSADSPNAPLDLSRGATGSIPRRARRGAGAVTDLPQSPADEPGGASISPNPGSGARAEFDAAIAKLRQGEYKSAEATFQAFIDKHPKDRLIADAVYYLGETYALRGRQREAAEQFLKVSTDYAKSSRAPDGMVRLGVSLNALGAKEQACATFGEVPRKFPNASASVRNSAERESKRARC